MSNCKKEDVLLYAITDRSWLNGRTLYEKVEDALRGGVTFLQLREKHLSYDEYLEEAREIKALCDKYNVPLIINDNVDIALAVDASGVHVGQSDMEARKARAKLGPDKIIGVSAHNVEEALTAVESGADYLGTGAVFGSGTKEDANKISHDVVRDICKAVDIPVVGIGGITEDNLMELKGTGIDGVAVISAIFAKADITAATKNLKKLTTEMIQ